MPAANNNISVKTSEGGSLNKRLFTESEAAMYLSISPNTLRQQRSEGKRKNRMPLVPYIKMGRSIRYFPEDLDRYLDHLRSEQILSIDSGHATTQHQQSQ